VLRRLNRPGPCKLIRWRSLTRPGFRRIVERDAGLRWRRPIEWTAAMNQFAILFGDRLVPSAHWRHKMQPGSSLTQTLGHSRRYRAKPETIT